MDRALRHIETILGIIADDRTDLERLRDENEELHQMLNWRQETEKGVAGAYLSRFGRQELDPFSRSGLTAVALERAFERLEARAMAGLGEVFIAAEEAYGVNALVLVGIVALESAWGTSYIAQVKNNLAGIGAYDHDPLGCAHDYSSPDDSIFDLAKLLWEKYSVGGKYYGGPGLEGIGVNYATSPEWARKVTIRMQQIIEAIAETEVHA